MNDENEVPEQKPERDPRELAIHRLSVREYAASEMKQYLRRKGFSSNEASETVDQLVSEGLIDDRRYARVVTRHQAHRDKGPMYVAMKLKQKGVRIDVREVREMVRETTNQDELEIARRTLEKRYPNAAHDEKEYRRAYAALLRRGFSGEVVRRCMRSLGRDIDID